MEKFFTHTKVATDWCQRKRKGYTFLCHYFIKFLIITLQKIQDATQKRNIESKYKQEDLFVVTQTYTPNDVFDLYAQAEDVVGVIKRKDPSGQEHRWYVDRGETKGFLPQFILTPHRKQVGLLQAQQSIESCSSMVSSHSSDRSTSLLSYENIDLLTEQNRYDTVPEEDFTGTLDPNPSLLSFDDIDHPANFETTNSLLEFDPLASDPTPNRLPSPVLKEQPHSASRPTSSFANAPTITDNVYHAAYHFNAADKNQLSLEFGQRVLVKQKCDLQGNAEWWLVINSFGKEGYVPGNYLRKK